MDPRLNIINKRLENIKRVIAVSGGKGGIGKSQTAAALAQYLSMQNYRVGLLDLDFCGPSSHLILGIDDVFPEEDMGILPPLVGGIHFMSITFFSGGQPAPLRGGEISNAIIEILAITRWGPLDFLIIDMPPGTGDPTLDVIRLMERVEFLLVTTPSRVAQEVMKKELSVLRELHIPVIGVLENMKIKNNSPTEEVLAGLQVPFLGSIDFDEDLEDALGNTDKLLATGFVKQLGQILAHSQMIS
ncbi:MAG: P-loop NTPase [Desulfotomaculaceae bacterium]|nr:P-loop NTPase [Desulfotomaculaceae bacterium]